MADLAAIMARRRAAADSDEGMYFNSPPASRNTSVVPQNGSRAPQQQPERPAQATPKTREEKEPTPIQTNLHAPLSAPKSNGSSGPTLQPVLHSKPVQPPSIATLPPASAGAAVGGLQSDSDSESEDEEDQFQDDIAAYQEALREKDAERAGVVDESEVSAYQLQLRNRDEADAVAGIATGQNLSHMVSAREAPKSASSMPRTGDGLNAGVTPVMTGGAVRSNVAPSQIPPSSAMSHHSALGGGAYHGNIMGSAAEECTCTAGAKTLCPYCLMMNGPASSASTMSSVASSAPLSGITAPNSYSSYMGLPSQNPNKKTVAGPRPGWSAKSAAANGSLHPPPHRKKGGCFSCFRPAVEEEDGVQATAAGRMVEDQNELVDDGIPLGGVTSTSQDVMDAGGVVLQCNVGLSLDDEGGPSNSGIYNAPVSTGPGPQSSISMTAPMSCGSAAPQSWTPPSAMQPHQQPPSTSLMAPNSGSSLAAREALLQQPAYKPGVRANRGRTAPTSGTSLYSVSENSQSVMLEAPGTGATGIVPVSPAHKHSAPISASLQVRASSEALAACECVCGKSCGKSLTLVPNKPHSICKGLMTEEAN